MALPAVGVEDEPARLRVEAAADDHARGGIAVGVHGGERHRGRALHRLRRPRRASASTRGKRIGGQGSGSGSFIAAQSTLAGASYNEPRPGDPCATSSPASSAAPFAEYHQALVDEIAARFDLPFTRRQGIPAHFTLKYHFETDDIAPVEALLAGFARAHAAAPVDGGRLRPLRRGRGLCDGDALAGRARCARRPSPRSAACPGCPWSPHDGERLRPHMTVAEFCRPRFAEVWRFLQRPRRARFDGRPRQSHPAPPGGRGGRHHALGRAPDLSARGRRGASPPP